MTAPGEGRSVDMFDPACGVYRLATLGAGAGPILAGVDASTVNGAWIVQA